MPPLYFDDLRDIHGLDNISWLPPALGYWLILLSIIGLAWLIRAWLRRGDWRVAARQELAHLKHQRHRLTPKELATAFSELLRRVAMARYGREACAGLHGQEWLAWLEAHDPKAFPWTDAGKILLNLPYAPPDAAGDAQQMPTLFRALQRWMDEDLPQTQARKTQVRRWLRAKAGGLARLKG